MSATTFQKIDVFGWLEKLVVLGYTYFEAIELIKLKQKWENDLCLVVETQVSVSRFGS